jgi:phage head maturation protease
MENGNVFRTIKKIKRLYDVAPVTFPAYEATSVMARAKEILNKNNKTEDNSSTDAIKQRELYLLKLNSN